MLGMQRLAVDELLTAAAKVAPREGMLELRLGIVEVHNEKLIDLLDDLPLDDQKSESTSNGGKLELRQGKDGHPYVDGLTWHGVASADAAQALVHAASVRRVTADNGLNERSSRSHLVLLYQLHAASAGADSPRPLQPPLLVDCSPWLILPDRSGWRAPRQAARCRRRPPRSTSRSRPSAM